MRILIADKFPRKQLDRLTELGHECVLEPDLGGEDLPARIAGHEALIVRSTRVTKETIAAGDRLQIVVRAGAGTNTIDKQAAAEKGVRVCNVPGANALAVAELALALILAIDRNIPDNVIDLRQGQWNKKRYAEAKGIHGRSLGIVGLGAIGFAVAERARAFGMRLYALRKRGRGAEAEARIEALGIALVDDLGALAERCDILSFHVPAADETRRLVNRELLARMRPGAVVINTARGDIIDERALIEAMDEKGIRAGLDVYEGEPASGQGEFHSPLAQHPNVYGTHHIGASTAQAQDAVAEGVIEVLTAFEQGRMLNCVNAGG